MPPLKNARHEAFAQGVAKGLTAEAAYEAAGYVRSRSAASRVSTNVNVKARIAELVGAAAEKAEVEIERVLAELARIGFSDVRQFFNEGGQLRPIQDLEDDVARAVSSIEVVVKPGGIETVHKVKMWDKLGALEKLAKHLGMFSGAQPPGEGDGLTDVELAQRLAGILVAGAAAAGGDAGEGG